MSKALNHYRSYLYGGEAGSSESTSSLYSGVSSPFKPLKFPELVNNAVSSPESTEDKLTLPRVDLLSKFRNSVQDNTRNISMISSPTVPRMSEDNNIPEFPSVEKISQKLGVFNPEEFTRKTYQKESGGNYKAMSKTSTATGKYQFLWGKGPGKGWQDDIKKVTGIQTREEFRDNPAAQEKFYKYYLDNVVAPATNNLSKMGAKFGLTPTEVARVIHFQGVEGARKAFKSGDLDTATKINPSINQYLGKSPAKKK